MQKKILAVDFGERRIGIALSDQSHIIATPCTTLDTQKVPNPIEAIAAIAREEDAGLIVVGYPYHADGTASEKTKSVDAFIERLASALPDIGIERIDEGYSSVAAQDILITGRRNRRADKKTIDRFAAAVFLQDYLNEHQER